MKTNAILSCLIVSLVAGCAAQVEDGADVAVSAEGLTLQECAEQRSACYLGHPLFGLFTCPGQYAQCLATAEDGIPAQVTAAIADTAACVEEGRGCRMAAENAEDALACTASEAACIGAVVDAQIPDVVTGTAECVAEAASCIQAAMSVGDLAACGETFEDCAIDEVVDSLPPGIGDVVGSIGECRIQLEGCTDGASTPADLTECSELYIVCVGAGLGVSLPDPPVSEAMHCAEAAASCAFDARSPADLAACGDEFAECNAALISEQLTCEQEWTGCLAANPFGFLSCTATFLSCRD